MAETSCVSKELSNRFIRSFGVWNQLCEMLWPQNFLSLQALNRFAYLVGISRVQTKYALQFKALVVHDYDFRQHLIIIDGKKEQGWRCVIKDGLNLDNTVTFVHGHSLVSISKENLAVHRYRNLDGTQKFSRKQLP